MFIQLGFIRLSDLHDSNNHVNFTSENLEIYEVCDETDTTNSNEKLSNSNSINYSNDPEKIDSNTIEATNNWMFTSQDHSDSLVASVRERKEKELQVSTNNTHINLYTICYITFLLYSILVYIVK